MVAKHSMAAMLVGTMVMGSVGCAMVPGATDSRGIGAGGSESVSASAVAKQLIVKRRDGYLGAKLTMTGVRTLRANAALGMEVVTAEGRSVNDLAAQLKSDPSVEWVEPNRYLSLPAPFNGKPAPGGSSFVDAKPNDPGAKDQYHLGKINAFSAWDLTQGAGVTVAVLDTGVDLTHPDLKGNLVKGYDAIAKNNTPKDMNGHGTHVAGVIAAVTNNKQGVAGVAPGAKIMPIKVLGENGGGDLGSIIDGIQWATDNGAQVINMSLGGPIESPSWTAAVKYASKKNVVVVAAMGNERDQGNPKNQPAATPGVIAVGATDPNDKITEFSSYGEWISVAAPGYAIKSTFPTYACETYTAYKQNPEYFPSETKISLKYASVSGTSQASPVVAGVVAMMKAKNPRLTPAQARQALMSTALDLGKKGFDEDFGAGRVDALKALQAI